MAEKLQIYAGSSEQEIRAAAAQLRAAQAEWQAAIAALPPGHTYGDIVRAGQQISDKYAYVELVHPSASDVNGELAITIGGDKMIVPGFGENSEAINTYLIDHPSTNVAGDDAYQATVMANTQSQLNAEAAAKANTTGSNPNDPNRLQSTSTPPDQTSVASDSPDLAGKPTTSTATAGPPNEYQASSTSASASASRTGPPGEYDSNTANTTPVTQNGDGSGSSSASGRTGPPNEYEAGSSSSNGSTQQGSTSDDSGAAGGTGTQNGTAADQGGAGRRENNGSVTTGQAGAPSQANGGNSAGGTPNNSKIKLRPNKLHEYVNWTYNIGWYMLDASTYNSFTSSNSDSANLRNRPIAKSGGFKKTGQGLDFDLSIISLTTRGVIGNSTQSPGANLFEIRMQVMEPYGVSLIGRLKEMAGPQDDQFQIPYLLEIKWNGYDDTSRPVTNIPETGPKLIPVQIINITFRITSAGTVYEITMVPYSQQGINMIDGVLRQDVQLYGDSLGALLKDGYYSLKQFLQRKAAKDVAEGSAEFADDYDFEIRSFDANRSPNDKLATEKVTFNQEGGQGTVIMLRGMPDPDGGSETRNDPTKQYFKIRGGSTIVGAITQLAKNSQYYQKLIVDTPNSDKSNPLLTIKVVPVVKDLGKYDRIRKTYQKKIVYKIMPYYSYGEVYPHAGQADVSQRGMVKEYNYIFTGKNSDIVDVDLQYNLMYFKVFQKAPDQKGNASTTTIVEKRPETKNPIGPDQTVYSARTATGGGGYEQEYSKGFRPTSVQEYFDQALNSSAADLVALNLTIIGDPDWIPQDRSVRPKDIDINADNSGFVDNNYAMGIATDVDSVYVKLGFKTPRDYNDKTGLMELSAGQELVGGSYKVVTVESNFEGGKFTQVLELVRTPGQKENKPNKQASSTQSSSQTQTSNQVAPDLGAQYAGGMNDRLPTDHTGSAALDLAQNPINALTNPNGSFNNVGTTITNPTGVTFDPSTGLFTGPANPVNSNPVVSEDAGFISKLFGK